MHKLKHSQHHDDATEIERCEIWRDIPDRPAGKTRSAIPSLCARPTRNLDAIAFFAGVSSCGNEVKATSLHVGDRTAIVASLMPKGDLQRPSDKREDPRHEWSKMKHVCCREVQPRGRSARDGPRSWTSRTLKVVCEMDTSAGHGNSRSEASNLIFNWNVSSHADGTEMMGGDCSVSNAAADDCQTSVHHSENSKASSEDETETGLVIVLLAMRSGGTIVCLFK